MAASRQYLPPPYDQSLSDTDLARYRGVLTARQAEALRLRLTGRLYAQIGHRLGVTGSGAHSMVWRACWLIARATQQTEAGPSHLVI